MRNICSKLPQEGEQFCAELEIKHNGSNTLQMLLGNKLFVEFSRYLTPLSHEYLLPYDLSITKISFLHICTLLQTLQDCCLHEAVLLCCRRTPFGIDAVSELIIRKQVGCNSSCLSNKIWPRLARSVRNHVKCVICFC